MIPQPLFKSIMVVVFGGVGGVLLVAAFRRVTPSLRSGLVLGMYWLAINVVLDLVLLVRFTDMSLAGYFEDIGLRYLLIPAIAAAMGAVAAHHARDGARVTLPASLAGS